MSLGERVSYQLQSWRSVCVGASLTRFRCAPLFWRENRIWYEHELCFPTVCAGSFHFGRRPGWRWDSLVAQRVKSLPAMWEMWVRSLGQEDSLEKKMTTHSSILAWKIPWMEEPGGLQSIKLDTTERLHFPFQTCFRCDYWTGQQRYKTLPSSVQKVLWDSAS